jgi:lysophospholipase L1-like esterase
LIVAGALLATGCSSSHHIAVSTTVTATTALGDSVPTGTACNCTPYPQLTADDIARAVHHSVVSSNDAADGATSADVVALLHDNSDVRAHVAHAGLVMVEIGANDVAHSEKCATNVACYEPALPQIETNLNTIVASIHSLAPAAKIVMLDYWSVWLGGSYAHAQGPAYVEAANDLTADVDDIIRTVAQKTNSFYVDLRTAFRGPDHDGDETPLLAADGEHPNAEGHERIADAVERTIRAT